MCVVANPTQNAKRASVSQWLAQYADDVRTLTRAACDEVLDAFLAINGIQVLLGNHTCFRRVLCVCVCVCVFTAYACHVSSDVAL